KKVTNRPIQPEEYQYLVEFINKVETRRFEIREAGRSEQRARREQARERVPAAAYQHSLEDTDLPHRIYNAIAEDGYRTVGDVMEQYYLEPKAFASMPGVGATGLEAIEKMLNSVDFSRPAEEAALAEAAAETAPSDEQTAVAAPESGVLT